MDAYCCDAVGRSRSNMHTNGNKRYTLNYRPVLDNVTRICIKNRINLKSHSLPYRIPCSQGSVRRPELYGNRILEKKSRKIVPPPPPPLGIREKKSRKVVPHPPPPPTRCLREKKPQGCTIPPPPPLGILEEKKPKKAVFSRKKSRKVVPPPPPPLGIREKKSRKVVPPP
eukprot:jgi/Botrbrau1/14718/Bobra.0108s0067.1